VPAVEAVDPDVVAAPVVTSPVPVETPVVAPDVVVVPTPLPPAPPLVPAVPDEIGFAGQSPGGSG
jgi:hypothetical protein